MSDEEFWSPLDHLFQPFSQVFEYMHSDLEAIIKDDKIRLKPGDIKAYMLMTVKAVSFFVVSGCLIGPVWYCCIAKRRVTPIV